MNCFSPILLTVLWKNSEGCLFLISKRSEIVTRAVMNLMQLGHGTVFTCWQNKLHVTSFPDSCFSFVLFFLQKKAHELWCWSHKLKRQESSFSCHLSHCEAVFLLLSCGLCSHNAALSDDWDSCSCGQWWSWWCCSCVNLVRFVSGKYSFFCCLTEFCRSLLDQNEHQWHKLKANAPKRAVTSTRVYWLLEKCSWTFRETETESPGHISYRDSKLTGLLQRALGRNALTAVACAVTPLQRHADAPCQPWALHQVPWMSQTLHKSIKL